MHLRELVTTFLSNLRLQGVDCLPVDDSARAILRDWMLAARNGTVLPPRSAPAATELVPPVPPAAAPDGETAPAFAQGSLMQELNNDTPPAEEETEESLIPFFRPAGATPQEQWASLLPTLQRWRPLRELGTLRETVVPGQGQRGARIMFVGDAPGFQDEKLGRPFQGDAGAKLDGMLRAMGLTREDVYITHLVKCRPSLPRQTLNNRPPTAKEVAISLPVLECEVRLVEPRVIVALGVVAARGLLGCEELPLAACQNMKGRYGGVPVVVSHHPSYLLRTSDLQERRRLWEEMLRVMEMAGLPINERQRSYFLPKA